MVFSTVTRLLSQNPPVCQEQPDADGSHPFGAPVVAEPQVLLLGAGFETGNLGVAALASGTIAAALKAFGNAAISLLDYGKEAKHYDCLCGQTRVRVNLLPIRFSRKFWLSNNIARLIGIALGLRVLPTAVRDRAIRRNPALYSIRGAALVGAIAGGDSFSDIYGLPRLLYVTLPSVLVILLERPLILLPQTYGPFKSRSARWIARYVLRRAACIYSRDEESLREIYRLVGPTGRRAQFAYDMGFALEPRPPKPDLLAWLSGLKTGNELVGLNVNGLLFAGNDTHQGRFGLIVDYSRLLQDLVGHLVLKEGCRILLVPHVFGEGGESDPAACQRLHALLRPNVRGSVHLLQDRCDQHEIKYVIGQCGFFVGSRMHACIAALSQNVPAVGLAYSRKFAGVFRSVGMEQLALDLCVSDRDQVLASVAAQFQARERIRLSLAKTMPAVRAAALGFFRSGPLEGFAG